MELELRRNNIILFGEPEVRRESYWHYLPVDFRLLNKAVPDVDCDERDIVRVQRIGARSRERLENSPRPILVSFVTDCYSVITILSGKKM